MVPEDEVVADQLLNHQDLVVEPQDARRREREHPQVVRRVVLEQPNEFVIVSHRRLPLVVPISTQKDSAATAGSVSAGGRSRTGSISRCA